LSEVSLTPVGKEQIHRLESALLIGSILRPDVLEELRNPAERLTWVDSLAVAAAALAREKAKMTITQIAEELGRTEATIRNHIQGKTKAGQIVKETYEKFLREGVKIELPEAVAERSREDIKKITNTLKEISQTIDQAKEKLQNLIESLQK